MNKTVLSQAKPDLYASITEKIVAAIETGAGSYGMPWHGGIVPPAFPVNAATEKPYRGVNILALWVEAHVRRYISGHWASYRQWQSLGAQVRKGERGALIVFWKKIERDEDRDGEREESHPRFVARASYVFNAEQVDGWQAPLPKDRALVEIDEEAAAFVRVIGATVRHGARTACYRPNLDLIEMPNVQDFIGTSTSSPMESYHAVLFHELVHYSGAAHRLNRDFGKRFGDKSYAAEELVAELGAAFLCSIFRIANEPRPDHAAYIASWLEILKRDTRAIFTAASKAQEAVEYLRDLARVNGSAR